MYGKAILSMSVGRASAHSMESKLDAIADAGFEAIELFFEDLEFLAKSYPGGFTYENQVKAAHAIRKLCDDRGIQILSLQPFIFYEGLLDRAAHETHIAKLKVWFELLKILGADLIQIPTNFLPSGITGDRDIIVQDLVEVADLGLQQEPAVRFVYEGMAWGTFIDTWEEVWDIVQRVDRPNFGILLDTFQIPAREWADPSAADGRLEGGEERLNASLDRLVATVDLSKVFYIQIGDAELPSTPVTEEHEWHLPGQPARMSWARNARTFNDDADIPGYLPITQCVDAFINRLGFKGWVSCEVFSRFLAEPDPSVPQRFAKRASDGWHKLFDNDVMVEVKTNKGGSVSI
ncbi:hypothetical protein ABOM_001911 [Aspergillus bombycis]|uniref:Xylose isomerase-like TIM barrel domain-containing protein n=1 Tax=Aspergillus bombycis TaxID=109264 RepID=A0A1F8AD72_9EURO|nr:hypothetical protein ABOM_001911 [Aspergillus bombycis]OGM49673.1 hypothetical protein ABOM_001911 [Aspergillus bombycis]